MHLFGRPRKAAGTCKCEKDSKINKVVVHGYRVRQQKIEAYRNTPLRKAFSTKDRSAGLQALYETQLKKIRFGVKIYFGKKIPAVS
ncbi:MAG: hypothetical protein V8T46_05895 [Sutterella seckii]